MPENDAPEERGETASAQELRPETHREERGETAAAQEPRPETHREVRYLRHLIEHNIPVAVKVRGGDVFRGVIEYYDGRFIRLTRPGAPNLFIFKKDIQYLYEEPASPAAS